MSSVCVLLRRPALAALAAQTSASWLCSAFARFTALGILGCVHLHPQVERLRGTAELGLLGGNGSSLRWYASQVLCLGTVPAHRV